MQDALQTRIQSGRNAVLSQVELFRSNLGKVESQWKADDSRVTRIDHAISGNLEAHIRELYPLDQFCSEEGHDTGAPTPLENRFTWIADPVDGTNNYATGIPVCAISLGLLEAGRPVYGFLYDLSRGVLTEGGPGQGLLEDGIQIKPIPEVPLGTRGVIGMHFPMPEGKLQQLMPLVATRRLRSIGSGALNLMHAATGRIDGAIDCKVRIWDIAAAVAFAAATGRQVHFLEGTPFPLAEFSIDGPLTPYYCGTQSFCETIGELLNSVPPHDGSGK